MTDDVIARICPPARDDPHDGRLGVIESFYIFRWKRIFRRKARCQPQRLVHLDEDVSLLDGEAEQALQHHVRHQLRTEVLHSVEYQSFLDRKSTRLNSSHYCAYRMPSST